MGYYEREPFPYLRAEQYINMSGDGEIVITDHTIPKERIEWIKEEYRKWWKEREKRIIESGWE